MGSGSQVWGGTGGKSTVVQVRDRSCDGHQENHGLIELFLAVSKKHIVTNMVTIWLDLGLVLKGAVGNVQEQ